MPISFSHIQKTNLLILIAVFHAYYLFLNKRVYRLFNILFSYISPSFHLLAYLPLQKTALFCLLNDIEDYLFCFISLLFSLRRSGTGIRKPNLIFIGSYLYIERLKFLGNTQLIVLNQNYVLSISLFPSQRNMSISDS